MAQKILFPAIIITAFILTSCSFLNDEQLNGAKLRQLVISAIDGDYEANVALKGLIDKDHFGRTDFNSIRIDSGYVRNKFYYSVLLEYFDPLLNLFAVYDDQLRFYLLDKSLNGNLSVEWAEKGTRNFIFVQERFLTKDILKIDRLSIFEVYDTTAGLVYRSLSRLVMDNQTSYQSVERIFDKYISTKIQGRNSFQNFTMTDTFYVDKNKRRYLSKKNLFNKYVQREIDNFRWVTTKPQISAEIFEEEKTAPPEEYTIILTDDWKIIKPYTEAKLLKRKLSGTKYFNEKLNSGITILKVPDGMTGDDYSLYEFLKSTARDYKIRSTALYTLGKNYIQVIEHSCKDNIFILLLECPKDVYDNYKSSLDGIINSFFIDC